jgi:diguanylate cyclase (GGDEF)-like protein
VEELGQRNREIILLNEMGDMLQSCHTIEEAYAVLVQFAYQLFPTEVGAFYVLDKSKNLFEAVAVWGEPPTMERVFVPNACWALRRGQIHRVEGTHSRLICLHISGDRIETTARVPTQSIPSYICVPVITQGEAVGLFHLESGGEDSTKEKKSITEAKQQLVVTMARHVTLALANLNLQETLRVQSTRDPLTGLYNRRYMEESLERELRRAVRNQRTLGIILIDLDRFKQFNDTFGHAAGDALLRALGNLLQTCIRGEDIACRYGGEEFLLILPEASLEVTRQRAERLREEVKRMVIGYHDQPLGAVTLSLGVALFPDHGSTVEVLLQVADTALYQAKTNGRDQVVVGKSLRDKERSHSD